MWRSDRRAYATLALMALASLAGIAPVQAQGEALRERHEQRPSQGAQRESEARQSHRTILRRRRLSMPLHAGELPMRASARS